MLGALIFIGFFFNDIPTILDCVAFSFFFLFLNKLRIIYPPQKIIANERDWTNFSATMQKENRCDETTELEREKWKRKTERINTEKIVHNKTTHFRVFNEKEFKYLPF